ncbi:glucose-6-phosphate 1-dehydrogenase 2, chloroplastic-like [Panicum miliaceum]|uniref:Glucose-6-phosphate 1-dehydrogenase 2, chloroplastic-like n=1 Tax=Panicum miliaceum TaxID=4540 RepID=A0A3L6PY20_PANMI|nr:glucose-6-phosphate 1-dehydrogenase 2, chloroplastic-like [Panicum miliaceum]
MALSCMRCPAGVAIRRAAAPPPSPTAAVSFARCGFGRSAAGGGCWRIQAVGPQGGMDVFLNSTGTMLRLGEIETQPVLAHSIRCDFRCVLDARA